MPTKKMEVKSAMDYQCLKNWASDFMDYVPRESSLESKITNNKDFHSKLISGRLGVYWQYLIRHARSRSQVQHIRDNLKLQEFQDAKNKKNAKILSSTLDKDVTLKLNKPNKCQQDISSMTFELDTSNISNRSLLIKEFDETKQLVKKTSSRIHKTKLGVDSILQECEELKTYLQEHENQIDQNYEKLNFLLSLKRKGKTSIDEMTKYTKYLELTLTQRFDSTKQLNNKDSEKKIADIKNAVWQELLKCKSIINQLTRSEPYQKVYIGANSLNGAKNSIDNILLPEFNDHSPTDYHSVSVGVNESILLYIRSIARNLDTKSSLKDIEMHTKRPDELQDILDTWREKHVALSCEAKTLQSEAREVENDSHRQIKLVKVAITDVIDSDVTNAHSLNQESKKLLHRYFYLQEKQARLRFFVQELNKKISRNDKILKTTNLKVLLNLSVSNANLIEEKRMQINRLLQRNMNIEVKLNWLETKISSILNDDIVNNIREILYQAPMIPKTGCSLSASQDRVHRFISNFICFPIHLGLSINVYNNVCGRDVQWLLRSTKNMQLSKKGNVNSSMITEDFARFKSLMKCVNRFIEEAKLLKEKLSLFEESSDSHGIVSRINNCKDHTQLINKIDDMIEQVKSAQKQLSMKM